MKCMKFYDNIYDTGFENPGIYVRRTDNNSEEL